MSQLLRRDLLYAKCALRSGGMRPSLLVLLSCFYLALVTSLSGQTGNLTLQVGDAVVNGKFFALVKTNSADLSGTNTMTGSTRVVVNGDDAAFNTAQGTWSKTQALAPGVNHFFIAALDATGNILAATNQDIVAELSSTKVGGALSASTNWDSSMGVIHVTNSISIPSGQTLAIHPGAVVLLGSAISIQANSASLIATGAVDSPVYFLPEDGTTEWGELSASGLGGSLTLRHVETVGGRSRIGSSATGLLEDSYFHDNYSGSSILGAGGAASVTARRIHVKDYFDVNFNGTLLLAEDSLFENVYQPSGDAFEMSDAPSGSIVRRITVRRILASNSDAIDFNGAHNVLVDSCLLHDISDKGVSIGAACVGCASSFGVVVSNCLIYNAGIGSAVKDGSTASFYQNTILDCGAGLSLYKKYTVNGGRITNGFNNILWGNTATLALSDGAAAALTYSDLQLTTNYPGQGNINANPMFVNAAARDYHLAPASPGVGTGLAGTNMGVIFPVGGLPGAPSRLAALSTGTNPVALAWVDDADNETGFVIHRSTNGITWEALDTVGPNITNYTDLTGLADQKYYYRVRATNGSGNSSWSNLASATRPSLRLAIRYQDNPAPGQVEVQFLTLPGVSYVLQYRGSLSNGVPWSKLTDIAPGLGGSWGITNAMTGGSRFYRLIIP